MLPQIESLLRESIQNDQRGKQKEALECAHQALQLAQESQLPEMVAQAHIKVSKYHSRLGQYEQSIQHARAALDLPAPEAMHGEAYTVLAIALGESSHLDEAEEYLRRAADLCRQANDFDALGDALHGLAALIYTPRGQFQLALATMQEAHTLKQSSDNNYWGLPFLRAYIYQIIGDHRRMRHGLDELVTSIAPGTRIACGYYILWARFSMDEGDMDKASEYLRLAFRIATAVGTPDINVWVRCDYSRYHRLYGDAPTGLSWSGDAVQFAQHAGDNYLLGQAFIERAQAAWESGDLNATEADLNSAIEVCTHTRNAYDLARASFLLAALYQQQHSPAAVQAWLNATENIVRGGYAFILERERSIAFPLVAFHLRSGDPASRSAAEKLLQKLAEVVPAPLKIYGLGQFSVWQARKRIPDQAWKRRKAGELFRYLLLKLGHSAGREEIFDDLWPDAEPETLPDLLHQATSTLRHIFEPDLPDKFPSRYLKVEGERVYLLLPPGATVDFETFEQDVPSAIESGRVDRLEKALSLYTDDLFPMDGYTDWSVPRRTNLEEIYQHGLIALGKSYLSRMQFHKAIDCARRVLQKDSWNEDAVWIGMQAYLKLNNAPQALRMFKELEQTLATDLKLSPRADLRALVDQLLKLVNSFSIPPIKKCQSDVFVYTAICQWSVSTFQYTHIQMKKKYSFLLTVLIDEETSQGQLHGRIQKVGRNEFQNFTCTEELKLLIYQIVDAQSSPEQLVSSTLSGTSYFSPADSVTPAEVAAKSNS